MGTSDQAIETWQINDRLNRFFLDALEDDQLAIKALKSKSVASHFAHVHNVRLMWIKAAAPALMDGLVKVDNEAATKAELLAALERSRDAMEALLREGFESGRIKGFKPHPTAFLGYLISHETYHRAQAELALRQAGRPLDDKTSYGLWEWGVR